MHQPRRQRLLLIHRLQQDWLAAVPGHSQPHAPALGMPQGILAKHRDYGSSKGLSPCMASLSNPLWGAGGLGTGAAGTSLRRLPAPQLPAPQPPPSHDRPFLQTLRDLVPCQTAQWGTGAGTRRAVLCLQHQPHCIGRFFFPGNHPQSGSELPGWTLGNTSSAGSSQ